MVFEWEMTQDSRISDVQKLFDATKELIEAHNYSQSLRALQLMVKFHGDQARKDEAGVPYIVHPLTVARHAFELQIDTDDIIAACLLHDVVEDCNVTSKELDVSDGIREAVDLVSFFEVSGLTHDEAKTAYFERICHNEIAMVVKVLDRCNNISCMAGVFSRDKSQAYIDETEKYILPMLDILKENYTGYDHAAFCLEYHMKAVISAYKA